MAAILEDLNWLGLRWEEPVLRQSTRGEAYLAALSRLDAMGLLYPCFCTRREIADEVARAIEAPHGPDGPVYLGTCRHLTSDEQSSRIESGTSHALRLDVAEAAKLLRIHPKTLRNKARRGIIPGVQVGRLWRFRASALNEWLDEIAS